MCWFGNLTSLGTSFSAQICPNYTRFNDFQSNPEIHRPGYWTAVAALLDEGLKAWLETEFKKPLLMALLNGNLRDEHGVSISGFAPDEKGVLTVVIKETSPAPRRMCRWDRQLWSRRLTIECSLTKRQATPSGR